jgi:hypothetical protein
MEAADSLLPARADRHGARLSRVHWAALLAGACVAVVVTVGVLIALPGPFWVMEDSGRHLVPYTTGAGTIEKVRVADAFTVYVDREKSRAPDIAVAAILLAAGAWMLVGALLLTRRARPARLVPCLAVGGAGLVFLGLDEIGSLHETLGHNVQFLADLPMVDHPDNVILTLYALPALAYLYRFRRTIARRSLAAVVLGVGFAFSLALRFADHENIAFEERAEVVGALVVAAGFLILVWKELRDRGGAPMMPKR